MKDMTEEDRPYEKCVKYGAENLTDTELLAVLLRTGTKGESSLKLAERLLKPEFAEKGILGIPHWTLAKLKQVRGIGTVKAIQILCICELARRMAKAEASKRLCFTSPDTISDYYMEDMRHQSREILKLLLLDTKSRLIAECDLSAGTVNATLISPREIFVEAIQHNAVSIILLHNHPSGDPTPSREDLLVTRRVEEAGMLIGIELLDHIIIGSRCYVSLREKGIIGGRQE